MEKNQKKAKNNCLFFVFAVLLLVFAAFLSKNLIIKSGNYAVIYLEGKEYAALPLNKDTEFSVKDKNIIKIENGEAYVTYADCPDKLCIHQGKIGKKKGIIVCLPNKMTVKTEKR